MKKIFLLLIYPLFLSFLSFFVSCDMGSSSITFGNNFKASVKLETEYINGKEGAVIYYDSVPEWLIVPSQVMDYDVIRVKLEDVSNISELAYITLPNTVMVVDTFAKAVLLESITLPESMVVCPLFTGCILLSSITIPDKISNIPDYAFSLCTGLKTIDFGNGVKTINSYAFNGCTGLTSLVIPDSLTSIEANAFAGCSGITSLTIGNGVNTINSTSFSGCTGITSLVLGTNVRVIDVSAFENSSSLSKVTLKAATPPDVDKSSFKFTEQKKSTNSTESTSDYYYNMELLVPSSAIDAYKNHQIWGKFNKITAY